MNCFHQEVPIRIQNWLFSLQICQQKIPQSKNEKGYHLRLNQTQMQFTNPTEASPAKEQISIIPLALPLNWLRWRLKKFPLKRWQSCDKSIKSGRIASAGWEGCWVSERVPPLEVQAAESWLMRVERPSAPPPPPLLLPSPPTCELLTWQRRWGWLHSDENRPFNKLEIYF